MRDLFTAAEVAGALVWEPLVSSWLEGEWLADVPASSGSVTWSKRRLPPGSVELVVPRKTVGTDWLPGNDTDHPLSHHGQVLHTSIKVTKPVSGEMTTIRLGTLRITSAVPDFGTVRVVGKSMFKLLEDARLRKPMGSRSGGTLKSEARRLVAPTGLGVLFDDALTDRNCPRMTWGESRMDALTQIAKAWPARLRETEYGQVEFLPPLDDVPDPVLWLHDGVGGTVVDAYPAGSDEGLYNILVARGTETDDAGAPLVQAEAQQLTGPLRVSRFGEKPKFFASPLLTSTSRASAAAVSLLKDAVRESLTVPVTCAPDPRIELEDAVEVLADEGTRRYWGYVSGLTMPLTHNDGDMRVDVEVA